MAGVQQLVILLLTLVRILGTGSKLEVDVFGEPVVVKQLCDRVAVLLSLRRVEPPLDRRATATTAIAATTATTSAAVQTTGEADCDARRTRCLDESSSGNGAVVAVL
ncbi:hypothetical protein BRC94_00235 [Halobacteriales archaeon QS_5_70_17]|nr:MAG: hypothetical protein BRC94_00235 [Halobacteriales archaeon QS_5_70_17]